MQQLREQAIEKKEDALLASDEESAEEEDSVEMDVHEEDAQSVDDDTTSNISEAQLEMEVDESPSPLDGRQVKLGNTLFTCIGNMLLPQKRVLKGKEKRGYPTYKWSTKPPPPHRTPGRNIVPYLPGPVGVAKEVTTELDAFELYFNKKNY
ncbi:unnamed protein product [Parnassius apollo]|uniref:(apollo) hypothetical protein n=1 Tax=Parnassius apollo TaxID=110799 RepID=A0A8S3W995_PARAO|nr:unnamed protein product [Parnassius apollo]